MTRCSNNYGPYQFPEKLIPLTIANALAGNRLPVYGKGENVRDWIYVTDHCAAIRAVLANGRIGECYLIGSRNEQKNLDVVHTICDVLDAHGGTGAEGLDGGGGGVAKHHHAHGSSQEGNYFRGANHMRVFLAGPVKKSGGRTLAVNRRHDGLIVSWQSNVTSAS